MYQGVLQRVPVSRLAKGVDAPIFNQSANKFRTFDLGEGTRPTRMDTRLQPPLGQAIEESTSVLLSVQTDLHVQEI